MLALNSERKFQILKKEITFANNDAVDTSSDKQVISVTLSVGKQAGATVSSALLPHHQSAPVCAHNLHVVFIYCIYLLYLLNYILIQLAIFQFLCLFQH